MAIVRKVSYAENTKPVDILATLQDMWEWEKIETSEDEVKLYVNERTYIAIKYEGASSSLALMFNDYLVGSKQGYSTTYKYNHIVVVKTNVATTIQFTSSSSSKSEVASNSTTIILSNSTNRETGEIEKTASMIGTMTYGSVIENFICSQEINTSDNSLDRGHYPKNGSTITTVVPFASLRSKVTLNDVYLTVLSQISSYGGNCTLNGRKYYIVGCIVMLDE